jgi:hypothetical protein
MNTAGRPGLESQNIELGGVCQIIRFAPMMMSSERDADYNGSPYSVQSNAPNQYIDTPPHSMDRAAENSIVPPKAAVALASSGLDTGKSGKEWQREVSAVVQALAEFRTSAGMLRHRLATCAFNNTYPRVYSQESPLLSDSHDLNG